MARDLNNKVIAITGASSGIGAATALACAEAGMDVALAARGRGKLEEIAWKIKAKNRRTCVVTCDVRHDDDVEHFFAETDKAFGRLDAVFANAGYGLFASVLGTEDAQQRDLFETNYFGTIRTLKAAAPRMRNTPGGLRHFLVCSSAASEIGVPMFGAYSATKAAQDSIAGSMRAELDGEGFKVTSVHPVGTDTPFFDRAGRAEGPRNVMQSADQVSGAIVKALRRPRAEVWPMPSARWVLALATACPSLAAWIMRRHARKIMPD